MFNKEGIGVCGILLKDGTFLKCRFREHYSIIPLIKNPKEEENIAIFFSSKCDGSNSGCAYRCGDLNVNNRIFISNDDFVNGEVKPFTKEQNE